MQRHCNCHSTERVSVPISQVQQSLKNNCGWNFNDRFIRDELNHRNDFKDILKRGEQFYYEQTYADMVHMGLP